MVKVTRPTRVQCDTHSTFVGDSLGRRTTHRSQPPATNRVTQESGCPGVGREICRSCKTTPSRRDPTRVFNQPESLGEQRTAPQSKRSGRATECTQPAASTATAGTTSPNPDDSLSWNVVMTSPRPLAMSTIGPTSFSGIRMIRCRSTSSLSFTMRSRS